jgi:hypothetical protein
MRSSDSNTCCMLCARCSAFDCDAVVFTGNNVRQFCNSPLATRRSHDVHSATLPANTSSAGPVMYTWSSLSRHSICSGPPGRSTCAERSMCPSSTPATTSAQAPAPERHDAFQRSVRAVCSLPPVSGCHSSVLLHTSQPWRCPVGQIWNLCWRAKLTSATGERPPRASLPDHHLHMLPVHNLHGGGPE